MDLGHHRQTFRDIDLKLQIPLFGDIRHIFTAFQQNLRGTMYMVPRYWLFSHGMTQFLCYMEY